MPLLVYIYKGITLFYCKVLVSAAGHKYVGIFILKNSQEIFWRHVLNKRGIFAKYLLHLLFVLKTALLSPYPNDLYAKIKEG